MSKRSTPSIRAERALKGTGGEMCCEPKMQPLCASYRVAKARILFPSGCGLILAMCSKARPALSARLRPLKETL